MIHINIPGRRSFQIDHLLLDLNGTITVGGELIRGVEDAIRRLSPHLNITIVTADTRNRVQDVTQSLELTINIIQRNQENKRKLDVLRSLGAERTVAIGNGANDTLMLKYAAIGICVIGNEGASIEALINADLVVPDPLVAFELLLDINKLIATLRK